VNAGTLSRVDTGTRFAVADLYADYAAALDERRYDDWVELFVDDCLYLVQPRENADAGLPLATIRLESKGMLKDRVYGITSTLYHAPYYQRHLVTGLRVRAGSDARKLRVEANYLVVRTHTDRPSEIFNAGRYLDELALTDAGWRLRAKRCVFDSELIPNSLIYPV